MRIALRTAAVSIAVNLVLAVVKIATGLVGNSYALVADGIESTSDVITSVIAWGGLRISMKPPDEDHPYGHGKAESIAGVIVALAVVLAGVIIAVQSIREIREPHGAPAWYTLVVLGGVILVKEGMFRFLFRVGTEVESGALKGDAWHHRSDALTSAAAFLGISIALIGGEGYETADDWAALVACAVIFFNGIRLLRPALGEIMDAGVSGDLEDRVRGIAQETDGVEELEKCRIRKSGLGYLMDLHVQVRGEISVHDGHEIGHAVKDRLTDSIPQIHDVVVHVEPVPEPGDGGSEDERG
jgi:cation diffusion facilitator family transporter